MNEPRAIGPVIADLAGHKLVLGNRSESLEPRACQVLDVLWQGRGQVVSREELFRQVWRGAVVGDDALNRVIFDLRSAFRRLAPDETFIETVRKGGYRLLEPGPIAADTERTASTVPSRRLGPALLLAAAVVAGLISLLRWPETPTRAPLEISAASKPVTTALGFELHPKKTAAGDGLFYTCQENSASFLCALQLTKPGSSNRVAGPGVEGGVPSPDGNWLLYQQLEPSCEIRLRSVPSGSDMLLRQCVARNDGSMVWSNDSQAVIWSDRPEPGAPFALYRSATDGSGWQRLSAPPVGSVGDLYPALSPSGRYLAFFRAGTPSSLSTYITPGIGSVLVQDLDQPQDAPNPVEASAVEVTGLAFVDNTELVVARADAGGAGFWRYGIAGPGTRWATVSEGIVRSPALSGTELVFEWWRAEANLVELSLESGEVATRYSSTRYDYNPAQCREERRLAFVSTRSGRPQLWLTQQTSRPDDVLESSTPLTAFSAGSVETPKWSPDCRTLVAERRSDGASAIVLIDVDSGEITRVDLPGNNRVPVYYSDQKLLVASDRTGRWEVWLEDLESRSSRQISVSGGFYAQVLEQEDGDPAVVFSQLGGGPLTLSQGTTLSPLPVTLAPHHWGNWLIRDATVLAVVLDDGGRQSLVSWRGNELQRVLELEQPVLRESANLELTDGGRSVIYSTRTRLTADLFRLEVVGLE
ncbi:MAG: winged helix-turn-helix domain-containing protein [Pseudomonadota bacterium]